jgi:succinyl-diaminopimelate desuccinylase
MTTAEHLLATIDHRRDDLVALTRDLVRIPTVNPRGDAYAPCAELLGERLRRSGFAVAYLRAHGTPGDSDRHPRVNVVARLEAPGPGPCVHLNGHIDVVEAGQGWTVDPWAGEVRDGKVYGRGTCDMKGGIAAAVVAAEALVDLGLLRRGAIEISGTVDEESGGYGGVAWLAGRGHFSPPRVHHVIIPSPSTSTGSASATAASGGPRSRRWAASPTARCPSWATARSATWVPCSTPSSASSGRRSRPGARPCRSCRREPAPRP